LYDTPVSQQHFFHSISLVHRSSRIEGEVHVDIFFFFILSSQQHLYLFIEVVGSWKVQAVCCHVSETASKTWFLVW